MPAFLPTARRPKISEAERQVEVEAQFARQRQAGEEREREAKAALARRTEHSMKMAAEERRLRGFVTAADSAYRNADSALRQAVLSDDLEAALQAATRRAAAEVVAAVAKSELSRATGR